MGILQEKTYISFTKIIGQAIETVHINHNISLIRINPVIKRWSYPEKHMKKAGYKREA